MSKFVEGPWVSETGVCRDETGSGLAVIAVDPDVRNQETPTRGMVAWVHSFGMIY